MSEELIGRGDELRVLGELVERVDEAGGAVVVRGEAGIGKSAVLAAVSRLAGARPMRVLTTTGTQSEAQIAFAGLDRLLRPVIDQADRLPPPQRGAVLAALGRSDKAVPELFLVALATLSLLADAAVEAPVLLVVEDAQWLDRASAEALLFVARRLDFEPVVLVVALRDGFDSPFADSGLPELTLRRLAPAEAELLVDGSLPPEVRERVLREAAGNPLALVELPSVVETGGPGAALPLTARLEQAFSTRMAGLPDATRTLLLVAALNDSDGLAEVLEAATVVAGEQLEADDLLPAITARLVEAGAGSVRFLHPLMRSAIHQRSSIGRRQRAHAALARVVTGDDRRVWHRAAAATGPDDSVAADLEAAAVRAQRRGGIAAGTAAMERSAELTRDPALRGERLLRAAELAFELGRRESVVRLLDEADQVGLSVRQGWRTAWIGGSFDDGILGRARAAWSPTRVAEQAAVDDPDLA